MKYFSMQTFLFFPPSTYVLCLNTDNGAVSPLCRSIYSHPTVIIGTCFSEYVRKLRLVSHVYCQHGGGICYVSQNMSDDPLAISLNHSWGSWTFIFFQQCSQCKWFPLLRFRTINHLFSILSPLYETMISAFKEGYYKSFIWEIKLCQTTEFQMEIYLGSPLP